MYLCILRPRMSKNLVKLDQKFIDEIASGFVKENVRALNVQQDRLGEELVVKITMSFLAGLIAAVVLKSLDHSGKESYTKKQLHDIVYKRFGDIKLDIQNAVAAGFQGAMFTFSGESTEYYCQIKPVPDPINTRPC